MTSCQYELVAFDLDGVLVDGLGSWCTLHRGLGTYEISRKHWQKFHEGKMCFEEWAQKDLSLWEGTREEKIREILYDAKYIPGVDIVLRKLKHLGCKIVIISGGLQILADKINKEYDLDGAYANQLVFNEGSLKGIRHEVGFDGKGEILKNVLKKQDIESDEVVAVGDYLNDIPLFKEAGYAIAFNPKSSRLLNYADAAVFRKNLAEILPLLGISENKENPQICTY